MNADSNHSQNKNSSQGNNQVASNKTKPKPAPQKRSTKSTNNLKFRRNKSRNPKSKLKLALAGSLMMLLVVGAGAGYYLTQQNQDIRQQAQIVDYGGTNWMDYCGDPCNDYSDCAAGFVCVNVNPQRPINPPCFLPGTIIRLADGSNKKIESIKAGDQILSLNLENNRTQTSTVSLIEQNIHHGYFVINQQLRLTPNHPLLVKKQSGLVGWGALNPTQAQRHHLPNTDVAQIELGDWLQTERGWQQISDIDHIQATVETYNLIGLDPINNYFADGYLAHNKRRPGYSPAPVLNMKQKVKNQMQTILNPRDWNSYMCSKIQADQVYAQNQQFQDSKKLAARNVPGPTRIDPSNTPAPVTTLEPTRIDPSNTPAPVTTLEPTRIDPSNTPAPNYECRPLSYVPPSLDQPYLIAEDCRQDCNACSYEPCNQECGGGRPCLNGLTCVNGRCRNDSCRDEVDCSCNPTNAPTSPPSPTPTSRPELQLNVVNPSGNPVKTKKIACAEVVLQTGGPHKWHTLAINECTDCSSLTVVNDRLSSKSSPEILGVGGYAELSSKQQLESIEAFPAIGEEISPNNKPGYRWSHWSTGKRQINLVVVTIAPTPTTIPKTGIEIKLGLAGIPQVETDGETVINHFPPNEAGQKITAKIMLEDQSGQKTETFSRNFVYVDDQENGYYRMVDPFEFEGFTAGRYQVMIKGPIHRQIKFCQNDQPKGANCATADRISIAPGDEVMLDFRNEPLQFGDLPISGDHQDQQNGVVNTLDYSFMVGCLSKQRDPACLSRADANFDGVVNNRDWTLLVETLQTAPDQI
ncbi:MAG: hypothetical protein U9O78_02110 [Patescibacteria group bacterium]|nr:hypothetical protein [Patescibacteria group bacterium]